MAYEKVMAGKGQDIFARFFISGVALILVASLVYLTAEQIQVWRTSVVLWTYVIDKEPDKVPLAYNNRGMVFYKAGQFEKAVADFVKAVTLEPRYIDAYSNLGMAFYRIGALDKAIENFDRAITLDAGYYQAYNNRALAFLENGSAGKSNRRLS